MPEIIGSASASGQRCSRVYGIHARPITLGLPQLVQVHHQIQGSYRAPVTAWPRVLVYLVDQARRIELTITHGLPFRWAGESSSFTSPARHPRLQVSRKAEARHGIARHGAVGDVAPTRLPVRGQGSGGRRNSQRIIPAAVPGRLCFGSWIFRRIYRWMAMCSAGP
jgi:hypothetical protein